MIKCQSHREHFTVKFLVFLSLCDISYSIRRGLRKAGWKIYLSCSTVPWSSTLSWRCGTLEEQPWAGLGEECGSEN